ncbi:glycine--tRNA ligase subunit beta [Anaeroselena agilis]|uniref:Glycine--tRNA ligase beta subunit n=1 Tax=Anaeroselena agilis TaxID=3063788 RepID=A0ABU3NYR4_9FIRM|nr:glycine--tRNA ligase subunit beta [Selenomonadales bacterium 4137-cl]
MAKDLLLEIGSEEIPAKFMPAALAQLADIAKAKFTERRIACGEVQTFGTPRRLALIVRGMAEQQSDRNSENKGPAVKIAFDDSGVPTKAAQGFARGQGVDVKDLVVKDGYVYAVVHETGRPVVDILPELLPEIVTAIAFPKSMRWGDLDLRFARPIRWLVALFGGDVVPFSLAEVAAGNVSHGHRFLSTGPVALASVDEYFAKMTANHVMVDQDLRRQVIREQVEKLAVRQGGTAVIDEDLLEEVTYLVEYPTALCGRFEEKYLALPPEAVITPMREHQRYFPVFAADGKLLPVFITVRNGGQDYIDIVRHGNERVLKARLADARFFFEEDKKVPLADRVAKLKTIVFQEGLGTMYDKTVRLEKLAAEIARKAGLPEAELATIGRGAHLAKADLVTGMVYEFTELQGVMGREYAKLSGEAPAVAEAVFEHYLPRFAGDSLPQTPAGRMVSVADKLDNIVATFSRGLIPTGSQDPYALRRQALGIVNILIAARYHVSIKALAAAAMDLLAVSGEERRAKLCGDIGEFFRLRLKNVLADEGVRYDMVDAVLATDTDDVYDAWLRAKALAEVGATEAMQRAVQALTRAGNLAKNAAGDAIDPALFAADGEKVLYASLEGARKEIAALSASKDYAGVLKVIAGLADPIDAFFTQVMVMVDDVAVRNNRLALLKSITALAAGVADLSKIVAA